MRGAKAKTRHADELVAEENCASSRGRRILQWFSDFEELGEISRTHRRSNH
jgi:hypothetical protein